MVWLHGEIQTLPFSHEARIEAGTMLRLLQGGSTAEFLELSAAEEMLVNMKVALAKQVKAMRQEKQITQQGLAKLIGSSQSSPRG